MVDNPELISQQSLEIKISGSVTFSESPERVMDSYLAHSSSSYYFKIHPVSFIYVFGIIFCLKNQTHMTKNATFLLGVISCKAV